jgi:hypothetical protein
MNVRGLEWKAIVVIQWLLKAISYNSRFIETTSSIGSWAYINENGLVFSKVA